MMSLEVIARGTVVASQPNTDWQSCAFPQICVLPSGRWICCYRAASQKSSTSNQRPLFVRSDDEGKSWSEPVEAFATADGRWHAWTFPRRGHDFAGRPPGRGRPLLGR